MGPAYYPSAVCVELRVGYLPGESGLIKTIDEGARLLKLCRGKERRRDINATLAEAVGIAIAFIDPCAPVFEAALIRFTAEKVQILLAHEELGRVDRVRALCSHRIAG